MTEKVSIKTVAEAEALRAVFAPDCHRSEKVNVSRAIVNFLVVVE